MIPDYMDEYIAIALLLMTEKLKGHASKWKAYLDILPKIEDVYPSFIWSEEELGWLQGSPTYFASKSLRTKLQNEYEEVKQTTLLKNPGALNNVYSLPSFLSFFSLTKFLPSCLSTAFSLIIYFQLPLFSCSLSICLLLSHITHRF